MQNYARYGSYFALDMQNYAGYGSYFALDMQNYARYGSYYVEMLNHIDGIYPGLQKVLSSNGLSVQAQSNYPLRTAIDQRGEPTINCAAKTRWWYYTICIKIVFYSEVVPEQGQKQLLTSTRFMR